MSNNLERLLRIYNRLRRGPVTIEIISKWAKGAGINISNRQLYRDLNSLQHLHFAEGENVVEFVDEKNRKTWKLEYEGNSESLTRYDINSFFLFRNFIPASIQQHRKDSIEKFEKILYKNLSKNKYQKQAEANELFLRKTNYYDNLYGDIEHKLIEELLWALQNKRVLNILDNEVNTSNVDKDQFPFPVKLMPFELLFHLGRVHIAGLEATKKKLLIYVVDKSLKIEPTNDSFDRKKYLSTYQKQIDIRFGLSEPTTNKIYNIKIEFTGSYALSAKNFHWHKTAQWKKLRNDNYMLQMQCSIGRELIGFLALGLDKVKVSQPKVLKDLLIKKYNDTLSLYDGREPDEERANKDY